MDKRVLRLDFGDWEESGHNQTNEVDVIVQGTDISDDALRESLNKATHVIGVALFDLFNNSSPPEVSRGTKEALINAGYNITWPKSDPGMYTPAFRVQGEKQDLSVVSLVMLYISYQNPDLNWKIARSPELLLGSNNSILGNSLNNNPNEMEHDEQSYN